MCSQETAILPYPELGKSSPHPPFCFLKIHFNIILPYTFCNPSGLFASGFPIKIFLLCNGKYIKNWTL
jgi:hypothetical protein